MVRSWIACLALVVWAAAPVVAQDALITVTLGQLTAQRVGAAPPAVDTARVVHHATVPCGAKRVCSTGWDIAALELRVPATGLLPDGDTTWVRAVAANLGRLPSPEVPLTLAFQGQTAVVHATVPALAPGDTVEVPVALTVRDPDAAGDVTLTLTLDATEGSGSKNAGNNRVTANATIPEWQRRDVAIAVEMPERVRVGSPVLATLVVRNANPAVTVRHLQAKVETHMTQPKTLYADCRGLLMVDLPAIPPSTQVRIPMEVAGAVMKCTPNWPGFRLDITLRHDRGGWFETAFQEYGSRDGKPAAEYARVE